MKRSASILSKSFIEIPSLTKSGMKESEVAAKLAQTIRANGADGVEDILVQSGESSADPHHIASSRKIGRKQSIVIDTECTHSGYYADITRTIMIGNDHEFEDMYGKVLEAQTEAIKESRAGIATGAVDHYGRRAMCLFVTVMFNSHLPSR